MLSSYAPGKKTFGQARRNDLYERNDSLIGPDQTLGEISWAKKKTMMDKLPKTGPSLRPWCWLNCAQHRSAAVLCTSRSSRMTTIVCPPPGRLPVSTRAHPSGKSVSAHCVTSLVASSSGLISPGEVRRDQKTTQRFAKATT